MTIRTLLAVLAIAGSAAGLNAQTSQRISAGKANEYGLIYNLPRTVADIYLVAEITEEAPGEFHNYARRHLGVGNAITAASQSARLTEAVIVPRGVADPEEQWLAQFKNGSTTSILLTPDNIPLGINIENAPETAAAEIPQARDAAPTALETEAARHAITQEMARSSSTSKRAELAAQRIFELREMRSDILSGQADNMPSDGAAMQLVLDNLSAQEAALTAMFTGTRRTRTVVGKVTFTPDSTDVDGRVIARISVTDGIIEADNLAGAPVTLDMSVLERGELPVNEKGEVKTFPRGGVAYRVPGRARLSIGYAGNTVATADIDVAQLGVVFGLNPSLFSDKREPSMAIFDPTTGSVAELGPVSRQ